MDNIRNDDAPIPKGAIPQRIRDTYAIVPNPPSGVVTADQLEALARAVRRYGVPIAKLTTGQRISLMGVRAADVAAVRAELGLGEGRVIGQGLHGVQACPGDAACSYGIRDSLGLARVLEERFSGLRFPAKVKVGVSGCPMCCGESYVRDVGLVGRKKGWTVVFGGNGGGRPRIGDELASGLSDEEAVELVGRALAYYAENGGKRQRTARFVEARGIAAVRAALGL